MLSAVQDIGNLRFVSLFFMWLLFFWEHFLDLRQRRLMKKMINLPEHLSWLMTKDVHDKARAYRLEKIDFNIFSNLCLKIFFTFIVVYHGYYYAWQLSIKIVKYFGFNHENELLLCPVFVLITNIVQDIVGLPFNVYNTFVIEQKHGFNKQTPAFFIKDQLKQYIVMQIICSFLTCGVTAIMINCGNYVFFYLWLFVTTCSFFLMILYPEIIAPLFDKYSPLQEGELRKKIENLAASLKFPLYKIFVVEGSKRSTHSNAYLYGFFKHKRIVLFDTIIKGYSSNKKNDDADKGCETDEVLAVVAHELGHWKYNHVVKGYILSQIIFIICFAIIARFIRYTPMYEAFGFTDSQPMFIGLLLILHYILMPLNAVLSFITVVLSRRFEFQADEFSTKLGHGKNLRSGLLKLQKDNLGYPLYDKLYSMWHHSHPPIIERLSAIEALEAATHEKKD